MRRLLVLLNAGARGGGDHDPGAAFAAKLLDAGFDATLAVVKNPKEIESTVHRRARSHDAIVVGGGDGSLRMALGAILAADIPVGVWPLGTANDFARSLGIDDEDDCVNALRRWEERRIDVAQVNGEYFLNNASLGLPAEAAARLTHDLKQRLGVFATLALIPRLWRHAGPFEAEIESDDRIERRWIVAALAGNGRYEGGFPVRYSGLADGKLHVIVCRARTRWALFPILWDVAFRRMSRSARIDELSTQRVVIRTSRPQRVAVDGDVVTQTPATIELHPAALRVFA